MKERIELIVSQYLSGDGEGVCADGVRAATNLVNEALELAARECEGVTAFTGHQSRDSYKTCYACAAAIRKLKVS